jgi:hypothetical protein
MSRKKHQELGLMYLTHIACRPEAFDYLFPHQALLEEPASINVFSEQEKGAIMGRLLNIAGA